MKTKTVKVSYDTWKKLMKWKIELECTIDEIIEKILKIVPASDLNNLKGGKS